MRARLLPAAPALLLAGCQPADAPGPALTPASGPSAGGYTVDVAWDGPVPEGVTLGGVEAFVVGEREGGFLLEVQGAPEPGPADLVLTGSGATVTAAAAFLYEPPIDPAFDRTIGFGASIGAGVQSGGLTAAMAKQSAVAQLAALAGAYLGLPQVADPYLPPLAPSDVGPGCDLPSYAEHATDSFLDLVEAMQSGGPELDWSVGRRDVDVPLRNFALPGAGLVEQAAGPDESDISALFFGHLLHEPVGALTDPLAHTQLERALDAEPTLVIGVDLLGNDVIDALTGEDGIDPTRARPLESTRPALRAVVSGLAESGAWVFLADLPRPSAMPAARDAANRSRALGVSEDTLSAQLAEIDTVAEAYNLALAEEAAAYDNVVIVPLAAYTDAIAAAGGVEVDGTVLTTNPLGGLVGLDGIHFTATGNALLANLLADTIDATLGTALPRADLADVLAVDPSSPAALAAAGVDTTGCR